MALVIGGNATVATGMSPIVEAGLYADDIFIDGVTFTSQHNIGSAGQIQVEKYIGGRGVKPGVPGGNFTDREYTNTVVDINVNNSFRDSVKVPTYFESTMPTSVLMNKTLEVTQKVRTGRQESALAALIAQATVSDDVEALTADNIKTKIIDFHSSLRKKHAKPNAVIVSVDTYALVQKVAGKDFAPMFNDDVIRRGKIGMWLGMFFIEADLLDGSTTDYTYNNDSGEATAVDTSHVDFVMLDGMAFSIVDRLDALRVKESEQFVGSKVQAEICSGFRLTNPACAIVKKTVG